MMKLNTKQKRSIAYNGLAMLRCQHRTDNKERMIKI